MPAYAEAQAQAQGRELGVDVRRAVLLSVLQRNACADYSAVREDTLPTML